MSTQDPKSDTSRAPRQVRSFSWFIRRGLLDVGIALASLIVFALLFALSIATHTTESGLRWLLPFCWTAFICFIVVKTLKQERKNPVLWIMLSTLVALQFLTLRPIVQHFPKMHSATYMLIAVAETPVWMLLVQSVIGLSRMGKRGNPRPRASARN